ncbi:MAG: type II toxin-antitoxin system VapC family toxin [Candidatus Hydrothermarchaeales archaeon]
MSSKYRLLFCDAFHSACCKVYGIGDIATNDAYFERVGFLKVWNPMQVNFYRDEAL